MLFESKNSHNFNTFSRIHIQRREKQEKRGLFVQSWYARLVDQFSDFAANLSDSALSGHINILIFGINLQATQDIGIDLISDIKSG
mmetsp:Transcript_51111/g.58617  ORF Transcript_51111/g.58617 Transcript_51111/m.58617 type:complete len:86 (-) Transcript_51111:603-860(-)